MIFFRIISASLATGVRDNHTVMTWVLVKS